MAYQLSCETVPAPAYVAGHFVDGLLSCDSGWIISEVNQAGFFPPLSESEAYVIATAVALLFATVFGIRQLRRVIR